MLYYSTFIFRFKLVRLSLVLLVIAALFGPRLAYSQSIPTEDSKGMIHGTVNVPPSATSPATVSVHELKIPAKARELFRKGAERLNAEDPGGSVPLFEKAIHKFPNYYEAYYNLGLAQIRLGRTEEAARSFQSAIDTSGGKFPLAEFAYGLILCQQGNIDDAERVMRMGLAQEHGMPEGYVALGTVMLYRHKPDEAELSAREALTQNARFPQAYLILAEAHRQRKDYSAEVQDLNTYMSLEPKGMHRDFARDILTAARRQAAETGNHQQQ
jgi:Tfp pilus assembly protein PilF